MAQARISLQAYNYRPSDSQDIGRQIGGSRCNNIGIGGLIRRFL
jgi:hypothetical protein